MVDLKSLKSIPDRDKWFRALYKEFRSRYKWAMYSDWVAFDRECEKIGMPASQGYWNCPICKTRWYDCPHPLIECSIVPYPRAYPSWEDRPWR